MKFFKEENNVPYTPIIGYKKDNINITLIGIIHIASADYFSILQREINKPVIGFYEGIRKVKDNVKIAKNKERYLKLEKPVRGGFRILAEVSDLLYENDSLTFGEQWEKKDLRLDELINAASIGTLESRFEMYDRMNETRERLRYCNGNPVTIMRNGILDSLMKDHSSYWPKKEEEEVIIDMRNKKVYQALRSELKKGDHDKIGIAYGSLHAKGIDKYIRNKGFNRENVSWVPAW